MQAYTYTIKHVPSSTIYYGSRKSTVFDLGSIYFSSSKLIQRMIKTEGIDNFEFKIRRRFSSYETARLHETKLLQRINAVSNSKILNQAISSPRVCSKDSVSEQIRRQKISTTMKEVWKSPDYVSKQSHLFDKKKQSDRGKLGGGKRWIGHQKVKRKPVYGNVAVQKNNVLKTIKSNQVPAYAKIGWTIWR